MPDICIHANYRAGNTIMLNVRCIFNINETIGITHDL